MATLVKLIVGGLIIGFLLKVLVGGLHIDPVIKTAQVQQLSSQAQQLANQAQQAAGRFKTDSVEPTAAATTLAPCEDFSLAGHVVHGQPFNGLVEMAGWKIGAEGENGAAIVGFDTNADPAKVSVDDQIMLVGQGPGITARSSNDMIDSEPMAALYTVMLPPGRVPYKTVEIHLWKLHGTYSYAVYGWDGKLLYDPPYKGKIRDITITVPKAHLAEAGKFMIQTHGETVLTVTATC